MTAVTGSPRVRSQRRTWWPLFGGGLLLWVLTVALTLVTQNTNLLPTAILLGSFLVPVTFVAWAFGRWRDEHLSTELMATAAVPASSGLPPTAG